MKIIDIINGKIQSGEPVLSVEIIPPRNGDRIEKIMRKVETLKEIAPDFVSVTRGAGGSLRGGTVPISYLIRHKFGIETMAHLTCLDTSVEELENSLIDHRYLEIENILALRGDPPRDATSEYLKRPEFHYHKYACDLVRQINGMNRGQYLARKIDKQKKGQNHRDGEKANFCVAVAGHPEGHPDTPDRETGLAHLKEKVDAGADFIVTQMIFDPIIYREFIEDCRKMGIDKPIIPGIRPVTRYESIEHIENFFGVTVPPVFKNTLRNADKATSHCRGLLLALDLGRELLKTGAPGIHFYLMNDISMGKELIREFRKESRV